MLHYGGNAHHHNRLRLVCRAWWEHFEVGVRAYAYAMGCHLSGGPSNLDRIDGGLRQLRAECAGNEPTTFVCCTDGNFGIAVSWAAQRLGQAAGRWR